MALPKVGIAGLGLMGSAMASNLIKAGYEVIGHDVAPRARAAHLRARGTLARDATALAREARIVVTSLPSAAALIDVCRGMARGGDKRSIVIETSTLPIPAKQEARAILGHKGIVLLDCPLSGTGTQARVKDVVVYASGPRAAFEAVRDVMAGFSRAQCFVGGFGAGSRMKFIANLLVAIHNVAAAEALVLAMKAGLDPAQALEVLNDGAGGSRMLQVRGPSIVQGTYPPGMKVGIWQKDMGLIADFARQLDCPTPLFSATAPLYNAAMAMGYGDQDTASVGAVLETLARHERGKRRKS